ncbi:MAG TPA: TIGR01457 family HAD-type hydrolase [Chloroflexota bacterium]|nr:TIGR01457 family HAD-type hydrolase [Chloroflexota bacterium]
MAIADLSAVRGVLFDLDGVVYLGSTPLPGAQGVFDWLDQLGRPYCLVTNNSTRTPLQYQDGLSAMGIHVPLRTVYTSALATAEYLKRQYPRGAPVYAIGEAGLQEALVEAGFWFDDREPALVCVGLDQHLTYDKLKTAALAIRRGAHFIAANPDRTLPTEIGLVPGCGAILAALETATDVAPLVVGKPAATMLDLAIERLGVPKSEVIIIGDRLDTDIEAGAAAGITTVLVLTGVHRVEDIAKFPVAPNFVVDDLIQFRAALAGQVTIPRYVQSAGVP